MPEYKAWVQLPNTIATSHVVVELGEENASTFEARRVLEAQYPGVKILNLTGLKDSQDLAAERERQKNVAAGGAGLLLLAFGAIWFAPLLVLFGVIGYWEWTLTRTWHPLFRGLLIVGSALLTAWLIGLLLSRIARAWVSALGAIIYSAAALYLKYVNWYPPAVDWIWACAIAVALSILGWWSFGSCRDVLIRLARLGAATGA
jgi:hypothetical protein